MSNPRTDLDSANAWQKFDELARNLPPSVRSTLAREWARAASFEHASIASFNRFSLELLAVGAPGALIASANRAASDEVEHARLSFALASSYAGTALGPDALPLDGFSLRTKDLSAVARAAVEEGCVGETLAAVEASAAALAADVPLVRTVLNKIAHDEGEHAALAYRFVRWAIDVGGPSVRDAARIGFETAVAQCRAEPSAVAPAEPEVALLAAHGRLQSTVRHSVRIQAIEDVLTAAGRELFA